MATVIGDGAAQASGGGSTGDQPLHDTERAEEPLPAWLSRHRVSIPEPLARHLVRPTLLRRCMPAHQRVTVLLAGGGFGKTTQSEPVGNGGVGTRAGARAAGEGRLCRRPPVRGRVGGSRGRARLRRTWMRTLALAITLEERSGRRAAALDRFREFLGHVASATG